MNLKFLSAVVAFSLGCSVLGLAQKPNEINLREGDAKVRKLLAERAAKESKAAHAAAASSQTLTYWSGTIQHEGYSFPFTMLGTDPKQGSATTVIQVYVVPVKIVLPDSSVWDPATVSVTNRKDAIDGTIKSPIFGKTTWMNNGVNLGRTQYTDAFQRGSFWRDLGEDRDYHVLFQPVVQPEVEWDVPANLGAQTPGAFNGGNMADVDIFWLEARQNADGGWGETLASYEDDELAGRGESLPSQAAWALLALFAAGRTEGPAVEKGMRYLIDRQNADGTWDDPLWNGTGFPRVFYLKYHLYAKYFPLWALGVYRSATA